jgi:hypothetical protein
MRVSFPDVVGAIGAATLMVTFLLLQLGKLDSNRLLYSVLNAAGACLITFSLIFDFNFSAFVIEVFWILISLVGVFRILRRRTRNT